MEEDYVHGYSDLEGSRLSDQAYALADLLHEGTRYPEGSSVLEVGCGVGAQTVLLARNSPRARFTSMDVATESLEVARARVEEAGLPNVTFLRADIFDLPFPEASFDHLFVCFVLEHLPDPARALRLLLSLLKPGGSFTVIEGDHGSAFFHPHGENAQRAIECLVELQRRAGGDALIGRRLYPLMNAAGLCDVVVRPLMVYVDGSRPAWIEGFTKRTFTAMVAGVRERAIELGLTTPRLFDEGVKELVRTTAPDGVFSYTFFKGTATRRSP